MDAVSDLLTEVRARGAVFRQTITRPPWALRMASGAPLTLATMLRGHAWIVPDHHEPVRIGAGDIAVVPGDVPYTVADDPATEPSLMVTSADYCSATEGVERPPRTLPAPSWRWWPMRSSKTDRDSSWSWTGCWT